MFMPFYGGGKWVLEMAQSKEIMPGAVGDDQPCPIACHIAWFLKDSRVSFQCMAIVLEMYA
jgi:hypothetical protein